MTCSTCGAREGPTGLAGLKVRQWKCSSCGAQHDRDVNAAINTLIAGAGIALERNLVELSSVRNPLSMQQWGIQACP